MRIKCSLFLLLPFLLNAQFDYDRAQPFDRSTERLASKQHAEISVGSFPGPKGGRINYVLVVPNKGKPPYGGVIFQHGGGQSMSNYNSEAVVLAQAGAVSIIPDAPARGEGKNSDIRSMKLEAARDYWVEVVISQRRVLDLLLTRKDIDPNRIGYTGHSYGGIAGAVLSGIEKRISAFVLIGLVASAARHMEENQLDFWRQYRDSVSPSELRRTLELVSQVDPERFLPQAAAPILFQCAHFDSEDLVRECGIAHKLAGSAVKRLQWYEADHGFADMESTRDCLYWFEKHLRLRPVRPLLERLLRERNP
jgi:dipeptidyl aminopeptidase/acylaminoacyl peptidase